MEHSEEKMDEETASSKSGDGESADGKTTESLEENVGPSNSRLGVDKTIKQQKEVDTCKLCDQPLAASATCLVKERAIASLVEASKKRKDKRYLKFEHLEIMTVHSSCQRTYGRESNIKIALQNVKKTWSDDRERRAESRQFCFESNCFFCSKPMHSGQKCTRVSKQQTITNVVEQLSVYPKTEINKAITSRLSILDTCDDNYYADNNVSYHSKCLPIFYAYSPSNIRGQPISDNMSVVVTFIINYVLENSDECQFSLKEILKLYKEKNNDCELPRLSRIAEQLKDHFDDEIVIYECRNDRFICFKRTLGQCIEENWYSNRKKKEEDERKRIVEMAAHIILQDIRVKDFDIDAYNTPSDFLKGGKNDIPETLQIFLDTLIKTHKRKPKNGSWDKWDNRIITAGHVLMKSVRPKSYRSSVLLGLSSLIHTKYSARGLIDGLHNIGLCESYSETARMERSIIDFPDQYEIEDNAYLQFSYDNADHNTATISGHNTFHCMGGIMCVTPGSSVTCVSKIPRLKGVLPPINTASSSGFVPLTDFKNNKPFKLDSVTVCDWKNVKRLDFSMKLKPIDLLYFFGKHTAPKSTANWHGFMNTFHSSNTDFSTTKVIPLPFIKAPPSDYTTILTALIDARQRADKNKLKHCFVTFDLPLFMKASQILASIDPSNDPFNLRSIILRLGGFHLCMSFIGGINIIMKGSGLYEAFCTIFAELSAEKALTGHAFSRAVRGHLIVQAALATLIFKNFELDEIEKNYLEAALKKNGEVDLESHLSDPVMKNVEKKFLAAVDEIEKKGPTCQLWIMYFKLVCLLQRFIDAERSGNFEQHLQTVLSMIPFFFASGHHLYAKACLLYVQKMLELPDIMDDNEFDRFCNEGFFTIRRSHRFWSGIWSDMTIEQVLMRAMKCSGGLTHGRGLTEAVIAKWILARIAVLEIGNSMELFCNITFSSSEQHVDNRVSRMSKDAEDLSKVQQFFETYDPFPDSDKLVSIFSGVVGDSSVNSHKAFEIGTALFEATSNKKFTDVKFRRKDKIVHLAAANSTIKNAANEEVYVQPLLIFQKMSLNIETKDDIKEYASSYELSPIPLSLMDENGLRKTKKSEFFSNFEFTHAIKGTVGSKIYVIDGGFLLHKVVWESNLLIKQIVMRYVSFVKSNYDLNSYVIFDGYPEDETMSTKSLERSRRKLKNVGREIAFDNNTIIITNPKVFLSNEKNKSRLINLICKSLHEAGYRTKVADEDADRLIVATAIENARIDSDSTVIIVGEDTDLLVIFSQLAHGMSNIYFRRNVKGNTLDEYYSSNSFKYPSLQEIVAFLHCFCGCDTTSCFFNMGKNRILESMTEEKLIKLASVFYEENAGTQKIASAAFEIIIGLYSTKLEKVLIRKSKSFTLNDLRYLHYSKTKNKFALERLPPTEGAARQHALRVYYQLQLWLGNKQLKATEWGWQEKNNHLIPVGTTDPPVPPKILNQISCSCSKKGCIDNSCTCKKHGLLCSNLCAHCHDDTCCNLETNNRSMVLDDECMSDEECMDESENSYDIETVEEEIVQPSKRRRIM